MIAEAHYVRGHRRNKCSACVDGDGSGDVASLPFASGAVEHDLRCGSHRLRYDTSNAHTNTPHAQLGDPGRPNACRVHKFGPPRTGTCQEPEDGSSAPCESKRLRSEESSTKVAQLVALLNRNSALSDLRAMYFLDSFLRFTDSSRWVPGGHSKVA